MRNAIKKILLFVMTTVSAAMFAQTTVTWNPTQSDVTALTNTSVHVITVGSGAQSFQIYSTRPFFNTNAVKLEWDASANAVKMTDNGIDKAGIAIYVPPTSDNISNIVVYMHTTNTRKTLYASGNPCPSTGTVTSEALATTSTGYTFWSGSFSKDVYYVCGGRSGGSGDSYYDKVEVTFTSAPPAPVSVTGVTVSPTTLSLEVGQSGTLTETVEPSDASNKAVTWSSSDNTVATVANGIVTGVAEGTATITVTTVDGNHTADCAVTVTPSSTPVVPVTDVTLNKTSTTLEVGQTETITATVTPSDATNKAVTWSSSDDAVATVNNGSITAVSAGTATITVTSVADPTKTATCAVTVTAAPTPPAPQTGLTLHVPEIYEAPEIAGGYGGTLSEYQRREYEVYYINRDQSSTLDVAVSNTDKQGCITESTGSNSMKATDGWFTVKSSGTGGESGAAAQDEFGQSIRKVNMVAGDSIKLHVQGFDQFSFYAKDNSDNGTKNFKVFINGVEQTMTVNKNFSIRRFALSGESVIVVTAIGSSNNTFVAFSLRVAQEPRTKWVTGNDSTQVVLQTTAPKPIYYFTKYNSIGETRLEGLDGTGITLSTHATAPLGDTLVLGGIANCPVGTYNYSVVSYYNNVETSRVNGKFFVKSEIKAVTDTIIDAYQNEAIDDIIFSYYALPPNDVTLTWKNGLQPAGISGRGNNGKYTISGTPTTIGTYEFTVTVAGGNSVNGLIDVKVFDPGNNPVLYLYKNNQSYNKDGVYKYLSSAAGGSRNLITRKAKEDGLRPADQYAKYKWVLISEDVDADNAEILALARGECNLPVLSMKAFSYTPGRLNWGEPDNGSLTDNGRYITIQRNDHPIFSAWPNKRQGDRIMVLDTVVGKGLMPIDVNYTGTLCLATALTRNIDDYYGDGYQQTLLHEVPAEMHHNQKYICLPIGMEGSNYLSSDGKKLIDKCIEYILSNQATIELPSLAITEFKIGNYAGVINEGENLITLNVLRSDSDAMKTASPQIALASPMTFVTPDKHSVNADGTVDFSNWYYGVRYAVSDYINKRYYDVVVRLYSPEGIDNIKAGTWVNIFDIYGRKVTTTNEDLRTIDLPSGMYIVVTDDGQTIKIMR